jgi:hypothetical protein
MKAVKDVAMLRQTTLTTIFARAFLYVCRWTFHGRDANDASDATIGRNLSWMVMET